MPYGYADSESGAIRYPTLSSLLSTTPQPGMRARLANPLSPTGDTEMYYDGTTWRPVPKQELVRYRNADGITPVLELTAAALPLGAWTEVWQSAVLPNWMFQGGQALSLGCDSLATDSSSTATLKARVRVHDSAFTIGDPNDGIIGQSAPGSLFGTGLTAGAPRFSVGSNNSLYGTAGAQPFVPGTQARRILGRFGTDVTRIRFDFWPGAATNVIRLYSVSLCSE